MGQLRGELEKKVESRRATPSSGCFQGVGGRQTVSWGEGGRVGAGDEKTGFVLELQQAISKREEAVRRADEDVERLQRQVKAFKLMKYRASITM